MIATRLRNAACVAAGAMLCLAMRPAAGAPAARTELDSLLTQATLGIQVDGRRLSGPGADWLAARAAESDFFLFGEQHATADIALFAAGLFERIHGAGYEVAAVELGPRETALMEAMMRQDGGLPFDRYAREPSHAFTFAFFSWQEEVEFARTVLRLSKRTTNALWGLDQEFILGGPVIVDELERLAATDAQRAAVGAARRAVEASPSALGAGDDAPWEQLDAAFADNPEGRAMTGDILLSRQIYRPFTGGGGSVYLANDQRERFMKSNLHRQLVAVRRESGGGPKVFLKFGSNHLGYGHSPTHVLSLGTFVHEVATAHGQVTFNLMVDCVSGEAMSPQARIPEPCESYVLESAPDLGKYVGREVPMLIDLRALRTRRGLWKDWDAGSQRLIDAYDAYLALPGVKPATWMAPVSAAP